MQRSLIVKTAIILTLAATLLAQTASKSKTGTAKKPATSAAKSTTAASSGVPSKATVLSFLKHTFSYKPNLTFNVKNIALVPGTQITDVTVDINDPADPAHSGESHLFVLPDHKHAIAGGTSAPFDSAEPKLANGLPTQQAVIEFVRKHFMNNQPANLQADVRKSDIPGIAEATVLMPNGQGGKIYVSTDGKIAMTGEVVPFGADPYAETRAILAKGNGVTKGPANSPVTMVEFSDLQCPACKAAQPIVDQVLKEEPDIRFVFQNFPLDQIHPWAFRAAQYADCIGRENNAAFWKFVENVYTDQPNINTSNVDQKLTDIAGASGANKDKIKQCVESPDTKARIWASQSLGKQVEVQGTPTVFINGRKVSSVTGTGVQNMKMLIDAAKKDK